MNVQESFIIFKRIDDEIQACEVPPQDYINYRLTDPRKIKLYQSLIDSGVDVEKFFLANCILNKDFFIDYYGYAPDKCMTLYYSWDEILTKKRKEYFGKIIVDLKKNLKLNLDDRDAFLDLIQVTDYMLWSVLYPEDLELLLSLDDDWMKFHIPGYRYKMDFVKKVIKGHMVLKKMKGFDKLRTAALKIISSNNP